ncbi:MAG: glycosyltransferase [Candidatus Nanopelagicales bacterium]
MARILILSFSDIAHDPRILRHIRALGSIHDLVTCGFGVEPNAVSAHISIPPARSMPTTRRGLAALALRRTEHAYSLIPAVREAQRAVAGRTFDLVLANDINTLPLALDVAAGRPVVSDLHEFAPLENNEDWRWRAVLKPFVTALCADHLPRATAVTTVSDGIAAEYAHRYDIKATTITNAAPFRRPQFRRTETPVRLVHSGVAARSRGLSEMIEAAADIPGVSFDLFLVRSQYEPRVLDQLQVRADQTQNVRVRPAVPMAELPAALDRYDVGLYVLPPVNFNHQHALPNKFFDFVQSGLGLLVGPSPEMAELVRHQRLGGVTAGFSVDALRHVLSNLSPDQVDDWKRGSCAAAQALSEQTQAGRLRDVIAAALDAA